MRIFDAESTARLLPCAALVEALRDGLANLVNVPERQHHRMEVEGRDDRTLITMPAWDNDGVLGVKLVNVVPDNKRSGFPGIAAIYVLFDPSTGRPALLLDGPELTARRTAAVSALAASYLAPKVVETHLVVGAGAVASNLPEAYAAVREVGRTLVWARNPDQAGLLVERLHEIGRTAEAVEDLEAAVRVADVVSCATMAAEPVLRGRWLKPDVHVDLIGSYLPHMREADDEVLKGAQIWVDSLPGALMDAGELAIPLKQGTIEAEAILGNLRKLGERRPDRSRRTVFKSVGNARWDFLCASTVLDELGILVGGSS